MFRVCAFPAKQRRKHHKAYKQVFLYVLRVVLKYRQLSIPQPFASYLFAAPSQWHLVVSLHRLERHHRPGRRTCSTSASITKLRRPEPSEPECTGYSQCFRHGVYLSLGTLYDAAAMVALEPFCQQPRPCSLRADSAAW